MNDSSFNTGINDSFVSEKSTGAYKRKSLFSNSDKHKNGYGRTEMQDLSQSKNDKSSVAKQKTRQNAKKKDKNYNPFENSV